MATHKEKLKKALVKEPESRTTEDQVRIDVAKRQQDVIDDNQIEKYFKSQRELPTGRNFMWQNSRYETRKDREAYRYNFDRINWNSKKKDRQAAGDTSGKK